jgi:toxin FitB
LKTWLIDTALFATLGPASQSPGLRYWLNAHREPVFLSAASLVEIEVAIGRVPASQQARISALQDWLDGLLSAFGDRIHPADAAIAVRAGRLLPFCNQGHVRHRFHDVVLVATAQMHGHGLLTKREGVFGAWTNIAVASP